MLRPLLLAADNFTPPARTPWGGHRIMRHYKAALGLRPALASASVGESWELSLGPELPSRLEDGRLLSDAIAQAPEAYLGREAPSGSSALLLKWLDADDNLSVQIHPAADDPKLGPDETGKPESWYIVERDAGAGIYLGLRAAVSATELRAALEHGADVSQLLLFVPVEPGDFFVLEPRLPHAVGRGVTLIEPQYVACGKKGVTLRYWDWNRRYDASGKADPRGKARELQVERALAVTDFARATDAQWLAQQRCSLGAVDAAGTASVETLCGPEPGAKVLSSYLRVARLGGTGTVQVPHWDSLTALSVIAGAVVLRGPFGEVRATSGRTLAIPARLGDFECRLEAAHALLSAAVAR